jgi:hypothetical protein
MAGWMPLYLLFDFNIEKLLEIFLLAVFFSKILPYMPIEFIHHKSNL